MNKVFLVCISLITSGILFASAPEPVYAGGTVVANITVNIQYSDGSKVPINGAEVKYWATTSQGWLGQDNAITNSSGIASAALISCQGQSHLELQTPANLPAGGTWSTSVRRPAGAGNITHIGFIDLSKNPSEQSSYDPFERGGDPAHPETYQQITGLLPSPDSISDVSNKRAVATAILNNNATDIWIDWVYVLPPIATPTPTPRITCNQICDPNDGLACNTGEVCTLVNPGHSPILPDENRCRLQTYPNSLTCESPQCGDTCDPTNPICPLECSSCQPDGNGTNVCQPPATPTPTPIATPTATLTPTLPPQCGSPCNPASPQCPEECGACLPGGNGNICQPPPTPTPPLSDCHCDGIDVTAPDPKVVKKGEVVNFTIFAYTDPYGNPASYPTKVTRIVYSIYKDNVRVAGPIETMAALVGIQTREGKQVEVYKVDGTYTIPNLDSAIGVYKIDATNGNETNGLFCRLKHLAFSTEIRVAQASDRSNIFARFFNWLIGRSSSSQQVTGQSTIPVVPTGADSLQLGTFFPVDDLPPDGCTFANFQVLSQGFPGE